MKGQEIFKDIGTATDLQILSQIIMELSDKIELQLNVVPLQADNTITGCEIKLIDRLGVSHLEETFNKTDLRTFIKELEKVYNQIG